MGKQTPCKKDTVSLFGNQVLCPKPLVWCNSYQTEQFPVRRWLVGEPVNLFEVQPFLLLIDQQTTNLDAKLDAPKKNPVGNSMKLRKLDVCSMSSWFKVDYPSPLIFDENILVLEYIMYAYILNLSWNTTIYGVAWLVGSSSLIVNRLVLGSVFSRGKQAPFIPGLSHKKTKFKTYWSVPSAKFSNQLLICFF